MQQLTQAQSDLINNAVYTHDYSVEAEASYEATGDDLMEDLQLRFEAVIEGLYDGGDDLGGLCVYFKEGKLMAFFDYERFVGAVF